MQRVHVGKALGILFKAEALDAAMHNDLRAFYAPSECHRLVTNVAARRSRLARRHAEAVSRMPCRVLLRKAHKALGPERFQKCLYRVMDRYNPY